MFYEFLICIGFIAYLSVAFIFVDRCRNENKTGAIVGSIVLGVSVMLFVFYEYDKKNDLKKERIAFLAHKEDKSLDEEKELTKLMLDFQEKCDSSYAKGYLPMHRISIRR